MKKLTVFALTLMGLMGGQVFAQKIKGDKNIVTLTRQVEPYQVVRVQGNVDVQFVNEEMGTLKVESSENLQQYVVTDVVGGELFVGMKEGNKYKLRKDIVVYVPVDKNFKQLEAKGEGDITSKGKIKVGDFSIEASGKAEVELELSAKNVKVTASDGEVELKGDADTITIKTTGKAEVEADKLKVKTAQVTAGGSGEVSVNAKDEINAQVNGSGTLKVKGNPRVKNTTVKGKGTVKF